MRNIIKYAFIWLIGYAVGFYEMKAKIMKMLVDTLNEKLDEEDNKKAEES